MTNARPPAPRPAKAVGVPGAAARHTKRAVSRHAWGSSIRRKRTGRATARKRMGKQEHRVVDQPQGGNDALRQRPDGEHAPQHDRARLPGPDDAELDRITRTSGPIRGQERGGRVRQRQAVDGDDEIADAEPGALGRAALPHAPDAHPSNTRHVPEVESQLDRRLEQLVARKAELRAQGLGRRVAEVQPQRGVGQAHRGESEGRSPGEGAKKAPPESGPCHDRSAAPRLCQRRSGGTNRGDLHLKPRPAEDLSPVCPRRTAVKRRSAKLLTGWYAR